MACVLQKHDSICYILVIVLSFISRTNNGKIHGHHLKWEYSLAASDHANERYFDTLHQIPQNRWLSLSQLTIKPAHLLNKFSLNIKGFSKYLFFQCSLHGAQLTDKYNGRIGLYVCACVCLCASSGHNIGLWLCQTTTVDIN